MLSYLTTGSILFAIYSFFTGRSLKKKFIKELNEIIAERINDFQKIETIRPKEFFNFVNANAGIIMGCASPENLKKCLAESASFSASWVVPLLAGALNIVFGTTSYKLYTSIVAIILAVVNFISGMDAYFATQDNNQNIVRAVMNYKSAFKNDETVKMLMDKDPIMGEWEAERAMKTMTHWLDQAISIAQQECFINSIYKDR